MSKKPVVTTKSNAIPKRLTTESGKGSHQKPVRTEKKKVPPKKEMATPLEKRKPVKEQKSPTPSRSKLPFKVKRVEASAVAIAVLENLSRDYGDVCNFMGAIELVKQGNFYLALLEITDSRDRLIARANCCTAREHWVFAQAMAVLKKLSDPAYDVWPEVRKDWFRSEHRNLRMNQKFRALFNRRLRNEREIPFCLELERFYEALRYVLQDDPDIDFIIEDAHYGPGSTVHVRGMDVSYVKKTGVLDVGPGAVEYAARALALDKVMWSQLGFDPIYASLDGSAYGGFLRVAREQLTANVVSHDRLMFIFKNMTARRSIGAQPTYSVLLQLGVHSYGTRLLKGIGIDLSDQSYNRRLSWEGSRDWESENPWCTLDKSNASNSISNQLVRLFFPAKWSLLLQALRTPSYEAPKEIGGGQHTYQMYAGMGNGTTFFIETLIFWAMTYATQDLPIETYVQSHQYAVYGDDVILRRAHALRYMTFAKFMGFRFNRTKTFLSGPFRESCGGDYHGGVNVATTALESESGLLDLPELIAFHNNLADHPVFSLSGACAKIRNLARKCLTPYLPTDPQGHNGFRPMGDYPYYDLVRRDGKVCRSIFWQRPRTYVMEISAKEKKIGVDSHWLEVSLALLRASQSRREGHWSIPIREAVNYRIVPERDVRRPDVVRMLLNQLTRLVKHMKQPWYVFSQGLKIKTKS